MEKSTLIKHLKKKFNFEKFYKSLTSNKNIYNILDELHKNLGTDEYKTTYYDKLFSKKTKFSFSLKSHYQFSDKNKKIAVEDGTIFKFLNDKINCKPLFIAKKDDLDEIHGERHLNAYLIYLFTFKGKKEKIISSLSWNSSFGWEMNIDEIITKKISNNEINNKILKTIKTLDLSEYNYFFIYKSLSLKTSYFVKILRKKLQKVFITKEDLENIEDDNGLIDEDEENRIRNIMIFQLNDNLKIPHISKFIWYNKQKRGHHAFHSSNDNPKIQPPYIYKLPVEKGVSVKRDFDENDYKEMWKDDDFAQKQKMSLGEYKYSILAMDFNNLTESDHKDLWKEKGYNPENLSFSLFKSIMKKIKRNRD